MEKSIELKKFFREHVDIDVKVRSSVGRSKFINVFIMPRRHGYRFTYDHQFPKWVGELCVKIVHPSLQQSWGANITKHSITMTESEWDEFMKLASARSCRGCQ